MSLVPDWELVRWSPVVLGPWIGPPDNLWQSYVVLPRERTMVDEIPGTIAGRDEKGKPLTAEEVAERTKKKLEEDKKSSDEVKEQVGKEAEEAKKTAEAQDKADEEFRKKAEKAAEKEAAKGQPAAAHAPPDEPDPPQGRGRHR